MKLPISRSISCVEAADKPSPISSRPATRAGAFAVAVLAAWVCAATPANAQADESSIPAHGPANGPASESASGFVRTLDGVGRLTPDGGNIVALEANLPVLEGDRIETDPGSRVELVLPDGSVVRVGGGAEVTLFQLTESRELAVLRLDAGELQISPSKNGVRPHSVIIETAPAVIELEPGGAYSLSYGSLDGSERESVNGNGRLELTARRGDAAVETGGGLLRVREGQLASSDPAGDRTTIGVESAGDSSPLERWAEELDRRAAQLSERSPSRVDPSLEYAAAPLEEHGQWVETDRGSSWEPAVDDDWAPYSDGHWYETPAGLSWVAAEPWGWVTHHYGTWYSSSGRWLWQPGAVYSPAWVYWYWGPTHVAWTPIGHYAYGDPYGGSYGGHSYGGHSYGYGPHDSYGYGSYRRSSGIGLSFGFGYRSGLYGWVEAGWNSFNDWTFCAVDRLRYRPRGRYSSGRQLSVISRGRAVPRGLLTTDTKALTRARWTRPDEAQNLLLNGRSGKLRHAAMPDVSSFVDRERPLDRATRGRVFVRPGSEAALRLDGPGQDRRAQDRRASGRRGSDRIQHRAQPGRAEVASRRSANANGTPGVDSRAVRRPIERGVRGPRAATTSRNDRTLQQRRAGIPTGDSRRVDRSRPNDRSQTTTRRPTSRPSGGLTDRASGRLPAQPTDRGRIHSSPSVLYDSHAPGRRGGSAPSLGSVRRREAATTPRARRDQPPQTRPRRRTTEIQPTPNVGRPNVGRDGVRQPGVGSTGEARSSSRRTAPTRRYSHRAVPGALSKSGTGRPSAAPRARPEQRTTRSGAPSTQRHRSPSARRPQAAPRTQRSTPRTQQAAPRTRQSSPPRRPQAAPQRSRTAPQRSQAAPRNRPKAAPQRAPRPQAAPRPRTPSKRSSSVTPRRSSPRSSSGARSSQRSNGRSRQSAQTRSGSGSRPRSQAARQKKNRDDG